MDLDDRKSTEGEEHSMADSRQTAEFVSRRSFLRGSSAIVGGGALAYSSPTVLAAAGAVGRNISGPPYDCTLIEELVVELQDFPFSDDALALLTEPAVYAIADKLCLGEELTQAECDIVDSHGWLPAAELNDDPVVREKLNDALNLPSGPWCMEPDNQHLYTPVSCGVFNYRISNLYGSCGSEICSTARKTAATTGSRAIIIAIAMAIGTLLKGCNKDEDERTGGD